MGSKLQLHPLDAATLVHNDPEKFEPPAKLQELIHSLSTSCQSSSTTSHPNSLKAELRDYQQTGFEWMQFLARHELHGILADDMGLGKTLQTITHILVEKENGRSAGKATLVVGTIRLGLRQSLPNLKRFAVGLARLL